MSRDHQLRQRIAQEAARIMAEESVTDFLTAKRKAAQRLGIQDFHPLPKNSEIQSELESYQRLFHSQTQPLHVRELRKAALEALEFLHMFQPVLVGSVLQGTASTHSDINLQLFADYPEQVDIFLLDQRIPFKRSQKKLRLTQKDAQIYPSINFIAGNTELELVILPLISQRQAPLSPVDGKPMKRANAKAVRALLSQSLEI